MSWMVLVVLAIAFTLGGIAVFGAGLIAMPGLLALDLRLEEAVFLLVWSGLGAAAHLMWLNRADIEPRKVGKMIIWVLPGMGIGLTMPHLLPRILLIGGLIGILFGTGTWVLVRPDPKEGVPWPQSVLRSLLILGGILQGAYGIGGAAIVVYAQHVHREKEDFRAQLSGFWFLVNTVMVTTFVVRDPTVVADPLPWLAWGVVWGGNLVGHRIAGIVPLHTFRRAVGALIVLAAISLVFEL